MNIIFRELKIDDLEEVDKLYKLCFDIDTNIEDMKKSFLNLDNSHTKSYILVLDNRIIGHIKCDIINNIFNDCMPYMYLSEICTHPDYRGMGYGKLLLNKIEEIAKEKCCSYIFLNSSKKRVIAHKLYKSLGYEERDSSIYKKDL